MTQLVKNVQQVALESGRFRIMAPRLLMDKAEAINLAAWLIALADAEDEFNALLAELQGQGVRIDFTGDAGEPYPPHGAQADGDNG